MGIHRSSAGPKRGRRAVAAAASVLLLAVLLWRVAGRVGPDEAPREPRPTAVGASGSADGPRGGDADAAPSLEAPGAAAARPPLPAAREPRIEGRVVDGTGRAVPAARVIALPTRGDPLRLSPLPMHDEGVVETRTDGEGRFSLRPRPGSLEHDLLALAPGGAAGALRRAPFDRPLTLVVAAPGGLGGQVTDARWRPVAGARVRVRGAVGRLWSEAEARTDADGRYRIEGFPTVPDEHGVARLGDVSVLCVDAEGFAPWRSSLASRALPAGEPRMDVVLPRGWALHVRLEHRGPTVPAEGADVFVWRGTVPAVDALERADALAPWNAELLAHRRMGSDEELRIERLPSLAFEAPERRDDSFRPSLVVGVVEEGHVPTLARVEFHADGDEVLLLVRLAPPARVVGRVLDPEGHGVGDVWVVPGGSATRSGSEIPWPSSTGVPSARIPGAVRTAADGGYALVGDASDPTLSLSFHAPHGEGAREGYTEPWARTTVALRAGETTRAPDVVVGGRGAAPVVTTRITLPDGRPAAGAAAELAWVEEGRRAGAYGRTDADGVVRLVGPPGSDEPDGPPLTLEARAAGCGPTAARVPLSAARGVPWALALRPGHRLEGRLLRADGSPAVGARLLVFDGRRSPEALGLLDPTRFPVPSEPGEPSTCYGLITVADDGRFVEEDLPEGPYTLVPCAPGARVLPGPEAWVEGVPTSPPDLVLRFPAGAYPSWGVVLVEARSRATGRAARACEIRLRRLDDRGDPVESCRVEALGPGRYRADRLRVGTYRLEVASPGHLDGTVEPVVVLDGGTTDAGTVLLDPDPAEPGPSPRPTAR